MTPNLTNSLNATQTHDSTYRPKVSKLHFSWPCKPAHTVNVMHNPKMVSRLLIWGVASPKLSAAPISPIRVSSPVRLISLCLSGNSQMSYVLVGGRFHTGFLGVGLDAGSSAG